MTYFKTPISINTSEMAYLTCTSSPSLLGKSASTFKQPDNDGTNACAFLSLKIAELILIKKQGPNYTHDFHTMKLLIENLNFSFPMHINSAMCYDIDTANNLMLTLS